MIEIVDTPDGAATPPPPTSTVYLEIEHDSIDPGPWNPRRIDPLDPDLEELAVSIRTHGIIEPLVVRRDPERPGRFQIVAGERRWWAAERAGLVLLPCSVRELSDEAAMEVCVIENLQRKDLPAIEESRGVHLLLSREGASPESVAVEIGRSPAWVAQRAQIAAGLSERWRAAVEDRRSVLSKLSAGHLLLASRLPHETQDQLLDVGGLFNGWSPETQKHGPRVPTLHQLREAADRYQRNLSAAPWKAKDETLLPQAGPCSTCPKRSGAAPLLWTEEELAGGAAGSGRKRKGPPNLCLDPQCWQAKLDALIERGVEAAKAEFGDVVLVTQGYDNQRSRERWGSLRNRHSLQERNEPAEGWVPCIVVDGRDAGKLFFGRTWDNSPGGVTRPVGPKTLAERRQGLQRRREKAAIERVYAALEELPVEDVPMADVVLRLAAAVGTKGRRDSLDSSFWGGESCLDARAVQAATKAAAGSLAFGLYDVFGQTDPDRTAVRDLWAAVLGVFASRWRYRSGTDTAKQWYEAQRLAAIAGVDAAGIMAAVVEEIREPKGWGKLEAAEREAAAAARKARRTKKPPAAGDGETAPPKRTRKRKPAVATAEEAAAP